MNEQLITIRPDDLSILRVANYRPPGEIIRGVICEVCGIDNVSLLSKRRERGVVRARHIGMFLCRKYTNLSFPQIARVFLREDHTIVIHAVRTIELCAKREPSTARWLEEADEKVATIFGGNRGQTEIELAWAICSPDRVAEMQKALALLGYDMMITKITDSQIPHD